VFDQDRYWDITVEHAKAGPDDVCPDFDTRRGSAVLVRACFAVSGRLAAK
jgi:hypothetical protein